jgi:hypothetical protein
MVAKSLMAQYEANADQKFLKRCSISYMKLILIPVAIWKFGYHDGLSIDCKMKSVWSVIGKSGGSGGNAEETAITGVLRQLALLPVMNELREGKRINSTRVICAQATKKFQFVPPQTLNFCSRYQGFLKGMYAGNIGKEIDSAFAAFKLGMKINCVCLSDLMFYDKMLVEGQSEERYFGTFHYDDSNTGRCLRSGVVVPRVSSTSFVSGIAGIAGTIAIRIQAFFTVEVEVHDRVKSVNTLNQFPMVAAHIYEECGLTSYGAQKYVNPPKRPTIFALTDDVCFTQVSLEYYLSPTKESGRYPTKIEGGFINPFEIIIKPEVGLLEAVDIGKGAKEAAVKALLAIDSTSSCTESAGNS